MSKKRHKKKALKRNFSYGSKGQSGKLDYHKFTSPFSQMNEDEIDKMFEAIGENYSDEFDESYKKLQQEILSVNPILLLSYYSFYDLTMLGGKDPEITKEKPILHLHVELLQALALCHQLQDYPSELVLHPHVPSLNNLVQNTQYAFQLRRMSEIDSSCPVEKRHRFSVLESMRVQTQAVRNWGYPQQVKHILTSLFAPLEDEIESETGIRISNLIQMIMNLITIIEKRISKHRDSFRPVMKAKEMSACLEMFNTSFPEYALPTDEFLSIGKEYQLSLRDFKNRLICCSDFALPDIFIVSMKDIKNAYPGVVDEQNLKTVLRKWSLSFGELENENNEHFFMNNPVWEKPLIMLKEDLFFLPIPNQFLNSSIELMQNVIKSEESLYRKYEKQRSKFLENEIERMFTISFPSAKVYRGSIWHDDNVRKDFENDLLVLIDSFLLVVEAKSGKITSPAKRGALESIRDTIEKLLIAPSIQSKRFSDFLQKNRGIHEFPTLRGNTNKLDTSQVDRILRLTITLDEVAGIVSEFESLLESDLISRENDIAPTMSIAELELIFDILENTCEKMHYLVRRADFQVHAKYRGDELDLLRFYLDTGFNIGGAEYDGNLLYLWGLSKSFDPYFMQQWTPKTVNKPRLRLTRWWRDILRQIERRQFSGWTEIGYILLNVAFDDQKDFEKNFKRIQKVAKRRWRDPEHNNTVVMVNGPAQRQDIFVALAHKQISKELRNEWIENCAAEAMEEASVDKAVGIAMDIEKSEYPYSAIMLFKK